MKKIINTPESVVSDMLSGISLAHPELELLPKYKLIKRKTLNSNKVSLISGGGSGHEPAHAGFVGQGMLDAAVCGDVFASPSQIQVYQGIKAVASERGVLMIIKNYSGDMMNFKNGAYFAQEDGIAVDFVRVDDDIAVTDSLYTVGRRGVAGTVFVHKIAGAAAEQGKSLSEVKAVAEKTIRNVKSIGFSLSSCTVPAKGTATLELGDSEMEYGVGIHGEPGIDRRPVKPSAELAAIMLDAIATELALTEGNRIAVLVNGFGATPLMELYLYYHDVAKALAARGLTTARVFVGNYMTSIDMAGASLSVLKLDDELEKLLNEPASTVAMHVCGDTQDVASIADVLPPSVQDAMHYDVETPASQAVIGASLTLDNMIYLVDTMSNYIIRNEVLFCDMDAHAGDGDFGMSIAKGFRALKREWKELVSRAADIGAFLDACSMVIMEQCGGASGPIWGSAFRAAGKAVAGKASLSVTEFAELMQAAVRGIQLTGERSFGRGAVVGDKTLIDAMVPCADSWTVCAQNGESFRNTFFEGARAAVAGAKATEQIVARMGRAGTVGTRSLGYPDAGAYALGAIFTALSDAVASAN